MGLSVGAAIGLTVGLSLLACIFVYFCVGFMNKRRGMYPNNMTVNSEKKRY